MSQASARRALLASILVLATATSVLAGNSALAQDGTALKAGAGRDQVEGYCGACHSLDYVRINSPFLGRAQWQAEVDKMINAYGAPISATDAEAIVDYLAANYGTGG